MCPYNIDVANYQKKNSPSTQSLERSIHECNSIKFLQIEFNYTIFNQIAKIILLNKILGSFIVIGSF